MATRSESFRSSHIRPEAAGIQNIRMNAVAHGIASIWSASDRWHVRTTCSDALSPVLDRLPLSWHVHGGERYCQHCGNEAS
jgi:hypothetical protein